ncbi:hypothetical protein EDB85DRAFT_2144517 [Lactarius pseudohatsudake]|nr:hypothetical protein EDB85DRAFT_2144517 [Lactarius pseudohatsudake]
MENGVVRVVVDQSDALRNPDIKTPLTTTWETHARAPPPRTLDDDDDDDDGFCDGDTFLPFPGLRTLDGDDGDGTTYPRPYLEPLQAHIVLYLSPTSPMMGTPHRSQPRAHPDDTGCIGEDSAPAPFPVPVPCIPDNSDGDDTSCDGGPSRHLLQPRARFTTSNDVNGTTYYPFALLAMTTTRAAVQGTSRQFWLCALTQSSAVCIPYDDNDNDEGGGTVTPLPASLSLRRL